MTEWVTLFSKINKNVSAQEARLIFMQIDKNGCGAVSLAELVPVIFSKGTRHQIKLITQYAGNFFYNFVDIFFISFFFLIFFFWYGIWTYKFIVLCPFVRVFFCLSVRVCVCVSVCLVHYLVVRVSTNCFESLDPHANLFRFWIPRRILIIIESYSKKLFFSPDYIFKRWISI